MSRVNRNRSRTLRIMRTPRATQAKGPAIWLACLAALVLVLFPISPVAQSTAYADRVADVNGLRIHYLEWGAPNKPAMVLLHGIARHAHTFDHIAADFARDYHVLAVDMRGHGDSA